MNNFRKPGHVAAMYDAKSLEVVDYRAYDFTFPGERAVVALEDMRVRLDHELHAAAAGSACAVGDVVDSVDSRIARNGMQHAEIAAQGVGLDAKEGQHKRYPRLDLGPWVHAASL